MKTITFTINPVWEISPDTPAHVLMCNGNEIFRVRPHFTGGFIAEGNFSDKNLYGHFDTFGDAKAAAEATLYKCVQDFIDKIAHKP
jgi:hypothetical protein